MTNKLLSVEEAAGMLRKNILDACFDTEDILSLISAVRREKQDKKEIKLLNKAKSLQMKYDSLTTTELIELSKDKHKKKIGMGICIAVKDVQYRIANAVFLQKKEKVDENDHLIDILCTNEEFINILLRQRYEKEQKIRCEEREKLICSECGFPVDIKRELIFLDSNPLSFLECDANTCEKCGHQKDGSTIPIVAKKIREVVAHVQKRERKRAWKIIEEGTYWFAIPQNELGEFKKKILEER